MYFIYILKSLKDGRTYVGYSSDVEKRLVEHNKGKVSATKNRRPLEVLYKERFSTILEAKNRELYWKSGAGRRKLKSYFDKGFPPIQSWMGEARPKFWGGESPLRHKTKLPRRDVGGVFVKTRKTVIGKKLDPRLQPSAVCGRRLRPDFWKETKCLPCHYVFEPCGLLPRKPYRQKFQGSLSGCRTARS